ncbi:MAG: hypothetical protein PHY92_03965 [Alphaproteobacteria bacterium]|nr:hypothetical protein [Alphaproteobacteria bacterium]
MGRDIKAEWQAGLKEFSPFMKHHGFRPTDEHEAAVKFAGEMWNGSKNMFRGGVHFFCFGERENKFRVSLVWASNADNSKNEAYVVSSYIPPCPRENEPMIYQYCTYDEFKTQVMKASYGAMEDHLKLLRFAPAPHMIYNRNVPAQMSLQ